MIYLILSSLIFFESQFSRYILNVIVSVHEYSAEEDYHHVGNTVDRTLFEFVIQILGELE